MSKPVLSAHQKMSDRVTAQMRIILIGALNLDLIEVKILTSNINDLGLPHLRKKICNQNQIL